MENRIALWAGLLLFLIIILLLVLLGAVGYLFQLALSRRPWVPGKKVRSPMPCDERIRQGMEWFQAQEKERIYRTSHDGLKLAADLLPAEGEARGILVLMHGFHGSVAHDFSCAVRFYHELGFHLLCPHQRAHGKSEGRFICYGIKERYDCRLWAEYAAERFGSELPIFLDGISMGASTVLMASALPMPVNVRGIIADSGFTSPWEIFAAVLKSWLKLPPFPLLYLTDLFARLAAGFGFREYSAPAALRQTTLPVLLVHGEADDFVPCWMSRVNYEACRAPKELILVPGAGHGLSYLAEEERCRKALLRFFETYGAVRS